METYAMINPEEERSQPSEPSPLFLCWRDTREIRRRRKVVCSLRGREIDICVRPHRDTYTL